MENWSYTEELRSHLGRGARRDRYAGRDRNADRDIARMLSPWRRGPRNGGPDSVARHG